ncbi:hypothetical protein XNA1_3130005 [Xenorhabdus nematophila str. Anatoliense]|nr:hypothetical protein XNA1_1200005 [Xenorhabdus nematophila str. Anatoliense]CEE92817.1 hypothetical protein XNA1_3130005 [Xenorhabdus nematophila str. Anatoliense]
MVSVWKLSVFGISGVYSYHHPDDASNSYFRYFNAILDWCIEDRLRGSQSKEKSSLNINPFSILSAGYDTRLLIIISLISIFSPMLLGLIDNPQFFLSWLNDL